MKLALVPAAALLALAVTGCGSTQRPIVEPNLPDKPTWGGCRERAMQITDYAVDARGARTREAALAAYRVDGDHLVDQPARLHRNARVLLVGSDEVIHHALELHHTAHGWLVSMVESCS